MIPILYPREYANEYDFGYAPLRDALKCEVTEVRNGEYELAMTYYTTGANYDKIQNECIIEAKPNPKSDLQQFVIDDIVDNLDGTVEISAKHISYRASYVPIAPFSATGISSTLSGLTSHAMDGCPFTLWTDIVNTDTRYDQVIPKSLRACLGGTDESVLERFSSRGSGEYEWDNYNIKFHFHRGSDQGYIVRYGCNLEDLNKEYDSSQLITGAVAFWQDYETGVCFYGDVQRSDLYEEYPIKKTAVVDASEEFESQPTRAQLNAFALSYANELSSIKEKTEVEICDPENQDVGLCDTVSVYYQVMNGSKLVKTIAYKAKVIKTVFDVLSERYTKITIGENTSDLASTLDKMNEDATIAAIDAVDNRMVSVYQKVDDEIGQATTIITTTNSGSQSNLSDIITYYIVKPSEEDAPDKDDPDWIPNEDFTDFIDEYGPVESGNNIWVMYEYIYSMTPSRKTEPFNISTLLSISSLKTQYYISSSSIEPTGGSWSNSKVITAGYYIWVREHWTNLLGQITVEHNSTPLTIVTVSDIRNITTNQQTQIDQNTEDITLKASYSDVNTIVTDSIGVNLSPFFNHPLDDVYAERENEDAYWQTVTIPSNVTIEEIEDDPGWARVTVTSGSNADVYFYPVINTVVHDELSMLVEIRNYDYNYSLRPPRLTFINTNAQYTYSDNYFNIVDDGSTNLPLTKVITGTPEAFIKCGFNMQYSTSGTFDIRLSLYKAGYTGLYIPYNEEYAKIYDSFEGATEAINSLQSQITLNAGQIQSLVEQTSTLNETISSVAGNITDEKIASYDSTIQSLVTQTASNIRSEFSSTVTATGHNGEILAQYQDYLYIDQNGNGITIGKSDSDMRGHFDNDSLDFIDSNDNTIAWLSTEEGLGANMLSVGNPDEQDKQKRWNITVSSDGTKLRFARHI